MTRERSIRSLLEELTALVRGECPSLLDEDSGGLGRLSVEIDTALRAAPPAPAPELVALVDLTAIVERYQCAYAVMQEVNDGEQRVDPDTEGDLADEEREAHEALMAWTPAAPVEPPARPETKGSDQ